MYEKEEYDVRFTFTDETGQFSLPHTQHFAHSTKTTLGTINAPEPTVEISAAGYAQKAYLLSRGMPPARITLYPNSRVDYNRSLLERLYTSDAKGFLPGDNQRLDAILKSKKIGEQAGAAYPPQSFGSADP